MHRDIEMQGMKGEATHKVKSVCVCKRERDNKNK